MEMDEGGKRREEGVGRMRREGEGERGVKDEESQRGEG